MVNENTNRSGGTTSSIALGFVLGGLVGAGLALLFAPRTGKETRQRLADAGERWSDAARRQMDHAGEIASDIERQARSMTERG
jgi:gas vesicle protein